MEGSKSYKDLLVWKKSIELVVDVYGLCEKLPRSEQFGLISQMQRSAVAIACNIAEGQKRGHRKEFLQFLFISYGSGGELETQIEICKRLKTTKNLNYSAIDEKISEIMKMLNSLIRVLKNKE